MKITTQRAYVQRDVDKITGQVSYPKKASTRGQWATDVQGWWD
jgi:hypothetical protein